VSTIVHDLKNPLTGLMGYMELLKLKGYEDEMLVRMEGALERIRTMLEDILSLTAGEDELILNKEWHDLREIVMEVVRLLDIEEETHIDIRWKTLVYIDKSKMHNVIWNVLKNAVEAINKEKGEIDIKIYKKNKIINLEIKDNGKGIKKENQSKIFELGKTFDKHNGTGFGLASARKTVKAHEGTIDFISEEGVGTTFFIKIPING
jgi:two-component system, sporulation sensor kinase E